MEKPQAKIAQFGISNPLFHPGGIIVVADAEMVLLWAADTYMGETVMQQLKAADVIVLNKIDLIDEQQRVELDAWLVSTVKTVQTFLLTMCTSGVMRIMARH